MQNRAKKESHANCNFLLNFNIKSQEDFKQRKKSNIYFELNIIYVLQIYIIQHFKRISKLGIINHAGHSINKQTNSMIFIMTQE